VARRRGPISIFPFDTDTVALFARIGEPIPAVNAAQFDALLSCSAEMASFFKTLHSCVQFMTDKGLPEQIARRYAGSLYSALACTALESDDQTLMQLADGHATPGGINEQIAHELAEAGVFAAHVRALERVFSRLSGAQWIEPSGPSE
jgi:pyrroline-5-carboxylate reductase